MCIAQMTLAPGETEINKDFPYVCGMRSAAIHGNCVCFWRGNSASVIWGGTQHFFCPFHTSLYRWAVLHLPGFRQCCHSLKEKNKTQQVRDLGFCNTGVSICWEKSKRENTHLPCFKDGGEGGKGREGEKRNEIYWSCKLESSQVGPTYLRRSF